MGVLAGLAALVALAGCYAPALRDCTVSCAGPSECARGQVCGSDGLCAAPETAGRCEMDSVDAGSSPGDGAVVADAPSDGAVLVRLRVQVDGKGSVLVDGRGTCSSADPSHGNCMYDIASGVAQRVQATAVVPDESFLGWSSMTCASQGPTCTFIPPAPVVIVAKFGHPK